MKVLAINGSMKAKNSCTDLILQPLLAGMQKAGAETETVYLADKEIKHCIGCKACWTKTPGECVIKPIGVSGYILSEDLPKNVADMTDVIAQLIGEDHVTKKKIWPILVHVYVVDHKFLKNYTILFIG